MGKRTGQKTGRKRAPGGNPQHREALLDLGRARPQGLFYRTWARTNRGALDTWRSVDQGPRDRETSDQQLLEDLHFYGTIYGSEAPVEAVLLLDDLAEAGAMAWKWPGRPVERMTAQGMGTAPGAETREAWHLMHAGGWGTFDDEGVFCSAMPMEMVKSLADRGLHERPNPNSRTGYDLYLDGQVLPPSPAMSR